MLSEQNSPLDETSCQRVADRWLRAWRHRQAQRATCSCASRLPQKAEVHVVPQSGLKCVKVMFKIWRIIYKFIVWCITLNQPIVVTSIQLLGVTLQFHSPEQWDMARCFAIPGPKLWNSLPLSVGDPSLTLTQFCARLKTVLFCRAYETKNTSTAPMWQFRL